MEHFSIKSIKHFITITKITPILIAFIHLINEIISFLGFNDIPLNYIGGISLIPIIYLYYTSYVFKKDIVDGENILKELNPQFAKDKARDDQISTLNNKVSNMEDTLNKIVTMLSDSTKH